MISMERFSCRILVERKSDKFRMYVRGVGEGITEKDAMYKSWENAWQIARQRLAPKATEPGFAITVVDGSWLNLAVFVRAGLPIAEPAC